MNKADGFRCPICGRAYDEDRLDSRTEVRKIKRKTGGNTDGRYECTETYSCVCGHEYTIKTTT